MTRALIFVTFFVCLLSGCTTNKFIKAYEGENRTAESTALIKLQWGIVVGFIDNKKYDLNTNGRFSGVDFQIAVTPGIHQLSIGLDTELQKSTTFQPIRMNFVAGRKYLIRREMDFNNSTWKVIVDDMTDKERCWSTNVGFIFGPRECGVNEV